MEYSGSHIFSPPAAAESTPYTTTQLLFPPETTAAGVGLFFGGVRLGGGGGAMEKKRQQIFFSAAAAADLIDENFYDEQTPEKKRRLTADQAHLLERSFEVENKLEPEKKMELARELGLQPRQVAVWFQNRRARWKTKQLERDFDNLKASFDSLLADRDLLRADNDRLRCQVAALTEELQSAEAAPTSVAAAVQPKMEDMASIGSGVGSVVDGAGQEPCYYSSGQEMNFYNGDGGLQPEDVDCSDNGSSYSFIPNEFDLYGAGEAQQQPEAAAAASPELDAAAGAGGQLWWCQVWN